MGSDGEDFLERDNPLEDDFDASSGDSDEDDGEKPQKPKVSIEKLLKTALQEIADGKRNLTRSDHLTAFRSRDLEDLASDSGTKGMRTALHMLLDEGGPDFPDVGDDQTKALITALVQHRNDLLAKGDREGKTPLYLAIDNRREKELEWMVEAHPSINTVLQKSSNKQLYLHMAIKRKLKYFRQLVRKADGKTLALKDAKGNTILHLAVECRRCRKDQLSVIEEIVAKSDKEVQKTNGDFNRAGESPYLHHKKTVEDEEAKKAKKAKEAAELRKPSEKPPGRDRGEDSKNSAFTSNKTAARPASPTRTPMVGIPVPHGSGTGPQPGLDASTKARPAIQSNSRAKYVGGTANTEDKAAVLVDGVADDSRTPLAVVAGSMSKHLPVSSSSSSKVLDSVVEAVERFLKLHYLRSRSTAACMDILYGKEELSNLELYFDLSGRSNMTQRGFRSLLKQLQFEDALQYVAIPKIRIEDDNTGDKSNISSSRRSGRGQSYKDGSGRHDLVQVFTTLRQKGVRTVIRAMVDDSFTPPHTDEAIEEALRGMDVQIWDWKKTDLSTEVIYTAAPRVREVHLYWSGNNTVLRGWSEGEGLKKLTELRSLHLHVQQGIESPRRTQQYVDDFAERVKRLEFKHEMKLNVDNGVAFRQRPALGDGSAGERGGVGTRAAKDEQTSKHMWIDCMKRFRGVLLNAEASDAFKRRAQEIEEDITVALIDDGVDGMDWDYPLLGGRTFHPRNEDEHLNHPYYASAAGHGTAMAKLINFMCPRAKLYVLRLEDRPSEDGVRQITARSAAKAIAAAVKKGVHIISMSWSIESPGDEGERRELEDAISKAEKANILMFCSAADQGAKQTDTYPSRATRRIFTIGAAGPSGETNSWVGDPEKVNFTFPGDRVEIMDKTPSNTTREISGSSVATALAAGFCALLLYCVQVRLLTAREAEKDQVRSEFAALKRHEEMLKAFRTIGVSPESHGKFITVWEFFGPAGNERDRYEDPERLIDVISKIGSRIAAAMNVNV
ncbi:intracellular serine protease [Rhypophila decipiens]|uniref:Intracellular serine protease n=1 Tax=Rhypophila decipiens TaxID=261697 RepID=A0AAN6Y0X8_9PEZI|nr:intracellular serine protease [Rhypophila decipiens]